MADLDRGDVAVFVGVDEADAAAVPEVLAVFFAGFDVQFQMLSSHFEILSFWCFDNHAQAGRMRGVSAGNLPARGMARRDRGNYLLKRKRGSFREPPEATPLDGTQWFIDQKHPTSEERHGDGSETNSVDRQRRWDLSGVDESLDTAALMTTVKNFSESACCFRQQNGASIPPTATMEVEA